MKKPIMEKIAAACLGFCLAVATAPGAAVQIEGTKSSSVKLLGDSSMHRWQAKATALTITGKLPHEGPIAQQVKAESLSGLSVLIGVKGLRSNEGATMDKNMRKAMELDKFPEIRFELKNYTLEGARVTAKGVLAIHGVAKDVELTGTLEGKDDTLSVKGTFDLLMSDFGVQPPVMLLGAIKVKDKVTVAFDFGLAFPKPEIK
ncbi:MAG: YceI family protein [candidate division FCPU426 bacterium]